jgi:uncharacterized Tic20 family protein
MEWYYVINDERIGPISEEEFEKLISSGVITLDTLVWNSNMEVWESYGRLIKDIPPVIPIKKAGIIHSVKKDEKTEERNYGMLCHLASFSGVMVPFGSILGPLIIWLIKRKEYDFVDICGRESINFQISITIYSLILLFIFSVSLASHIQPLIILIALVFLLIFIIGLVSVIKASVLSNRGEEYRYPITIRFL